MLEEVLEIQASALRGRMEAARVGKLVLNLSGGLDSTLALLVCARALDAAGMPRSDLICLSLPGFGTSERTRGNARALALAFGADFREISIVEDTASHLQRIGHGGALDLTYENAQARERTQIALDIGNMEGGFMVGTGNMSEAALGFSTFGGDAVAMYNLNLGVPKTVVRALVLHEAHRLGGAAGDTLRDIHDTPVSPELIPNQVTEDIVGPYDLHDFFLRAWLEGFALSSDTLARRAEEAFAGRYARDVIDQWLAMFMKRFFAGQFKRSCAADGPQVFAGFSLSPRAGWRMPSDCVYGETQQVGMLKG